MHHIGMAAQTCHNDPKMREMAATVMTFKRLYSGNGNMFEQAMALYRMNFPFHEQREDHSQRGILTRSDYHFCLLLEDDIFVGLILYWEADAFIVVEHFCTLPVFRGRGLGRKALEQLCACGKTIIPEIDPTENGLAERRKAFYERVGFTANSYSHVHPPYHADHQGHSLVVMSFPEQLTQAQYDLFAYYLEHTAMEET